MNENPQKPSAPSCPPPNGGSWRGASSAPTNPPPRSASRKGDACQSKNGGSWRGAAIFPGSFDPFTIGHADIVRRGLQLFDRIVIAVGYNAQKAAAAPSSVSGNALPECSPAAVAAQRAAAIERIYAGEPRVKVVSYTGLTVDLAQREGARFLLRGVRSVKDFEYERDMAAINRDLTSPSPAPAPAVSSDASLEAPAPAAPAALTAPSPAVSSDASLEAPAPAALSAPPPAPPAVSSDASLEAPAPITSPASSAPVPLASAEASLETVLLIADPRYAHISSSLVRELQSYGRDVTPYLP